MVKYRVDKCGLSRGLSMSDNDSELPIFLSVDDPYVEHLATLSPSNRHALDSCILLGRSVITAWRLNGDYILVYPRGAFGELYNMQKSVYWGLKNASEKLKSTYMDMEESPENAKKVRQMCKDLDMMVKELDKKGWDE
jgi:hypothetical protein